jgi:hypothetical protein
MKVVMPLEVEILSLRVLMKFGLKEVEGEKIKYEQLNMISENRLVAIYHHQLLKNE